MQYFLNNHKTNLMIPCSWGNLEYMLTPIFPFPKLHMAQHYQMAEYMLMNTWVWWYVHDIAPSCTQQPAAYTLQNGKTCWNCTWCLWIPWNPVIYLGLVYSHQVVCFVSSTIITLETRARNEHSMSCSNRQHLDTCCWWYLLKGTGCTSLVEVAL